MELPKRATKDPYQELPVKDFSYINTQKPPSNKNSHVSTWIITGVIVVLLIVAGAVLLNYHSKKKPTETASKSTHQTTKTTPQATNIQLTSYSSTPFNLTVSYPTSWSVSASGSTSLSIISPAMALTSSTGKSIQGKVAVNVFNPGQLPSGFGTTSVAVLDSQKISFLNPTANQAAQSYLSFVQYPATTVTGGMDGIYLTGNNGYVKSQTIPTTDVNNISPLVIVSFSQCQTSACTTTTPVTIASSMWNSASFQAPILAIIKSFQFS